MRVSVLLMLALSACAAFAEGPRGEIRCEGVYPWHLQGVATDGTNVFWTFTTVLVKTDLSGKVLAKDEVPHGMHMGDLCCRKGKVYVGMNMGMSDGCRVGDEIWEYDVATLKLLAKHPTPEAVFCNNGLEWYGGSYWVTTSAPRYSRYNLLFRYSEDFRFMGCRFIDSGWTNLGVQTICLYGDRMLLGCYGCNDDPKEPHPNSTLVFDPALLPKSNRHAKDYVPIVPCEKRVECNTSEGMLVLDGRLWEAHGIRLHPKGETKHQKWSARLVPSKCSF